MKNKKRDKIELRIDNESKRKFIYYAQINGTTVSSLLRNYIKECIKNGKNN